MSYILEALRKADAERELGDAPELQGLAGDGVAGATPGASPAAATARAPAGRWRWLAAGAAMPVLALVAWRMLAPAPEAPPAVAQATQPAPMPAQAPVTPPAAQEPSAAAEAASSAAAELPASGPEAAEPAEPVAPAPAASAAPARKKLPPKPPPRQRAEAGRAAAGPVAVPTALPTLAQLPEELRRQVPAMSIGGSVYSTLPADRMLVVNGQVVREGAALAPELRLETIGRQTAVFSIRGQRFEMRL